MKSVVFVILTYFPDVKKITSLFDALEDFPVILVDNTPNQKDNFESLIQQAKYKLPKNILVVNNYKNLGYTGGVNIGFIQAQKLNANWTVILNDDLVLNKNIIKVFVEKLSETKPGIAGPFLRYLDINRWTTRIAADGETEKDQEIYISGSFFAVHKEVISKIGLLYLPYFIFYEEVEYCVRAKKAGFELTQIKLTHIPHKESSSFEGKSFLHQYYLARNHFLFIVRNAPKKIIVYEIVRFPKTIWLHLKHKEVGAIIGIKDFILGKFGPQVNSL